MPYADPEQKRAYDREYGNAQREVRAARGKAWREANPDKMREHLRRYHLRTHFGLTLDAYDDLVKKQGGRCAICDTTDTSPWDWFCIDHDHNTGVVRGLLCRACNTCIGQAKDDPNILRRAIQYLEAACSK